MRHHPTSKFFIISSIFIFNTSPSQAQTMPDINVAPAETTRPPRVAPLFEQPGVLTPRGTSMFEPALQFAYSSNPRLTVAGYTIIPTFSAGLVDVREVKRNSTVASLTARHGITNRFEVEIRVPYVYRSDSTVSRTVENGTAMDRVFDSSGKAIGDVELAARYQLNQGSLKIPYFVGGLRFKSRTGRDPFEIVTDCTTRCTGTGAAGTGLPLNLATGSGFYGLEPSLAWFMPSNPATFFGTFSYMHNFKRNNVSRRILNGESELLGDIDPPDSFGFNAGIGFALNDRASVSVGYDHISIGRTRLNHQTMPNSLRTQLGTIMVGFSYRLDARRTVNVSVGGGLTREAPDVRMTVRIPFAF